MTAFKSDPYPTRKAEPGLVSNASDPRLALCRELERLAAENPRSPWLPTWCRLAAEVKTDPDPELMRDVFAALDDFAPEGMAFGPHCDNPSCLGFWPHEDLA